VNTIFSDRLPNDPRFKALCREIKDPLRAIGALYYVWSGTQNIGLLEATYQQLSDCFPVGYRGVKTAISALYRSGWLQGSHESTRIVGNLEHVAKKKEISLKAREAALARWHPEAVDNSCSEHASGMPDASPPHADPMPPFGAVHRTAPHRIAQGGGDPPPPVEDSGRLGPAAEVMLLPAPITTTAQASATQVPPDQAQAVVRAHQEILAKVRHHKTLLVPPMDSWYAKLIVAKCQGDVEQAKMLVKRYVCEDRDFWRDAGWPLKFLAEERGDFERAYGLLARDLGVEEAKRKSANIGGS
jgi:hypothetical protein